MGKTNLGYGERKGLLKRLGYNSYQEYLNSDRWKKVRERVLKRRGKVCSLCTRKAAVVHHINYTLSNLRGSLKQMAPLCHPCHNAVEFDEDGMKRSLSEAQKEFSLRFRVVRWVGKKMVMRLPCRGVGVGRKELERLKAKWFGK